MKTKDLNLNLIVKEKEISKLITLCKYNKIEQISQQLKLVDDSFNFKNPSVDIIESFNKNEL